MLPQGNSATMGYLGTSLLSHSSMTPRSENSKPSDATKDTTRASVESAGSRSAVARSTRSEVEPVLSDIPEGVQGLFSGAMPKEEIGALKLLQKNPTYDGRRVTFARDRTYFLC